MELGIVIDHQYALAASLALPYLFGDEDGTAQRNGLSEGVNAWIYVVNLHNSTVRVKVNGNAVGVDVETQRVGIDLTDCSLIADGKLREIGTEGGELLPVVGGNGDATVVVEINGGKL